ncbi:MAG: glutathione transport system permease protein [Actinomycetota bacterium]|jgi:peptide/nickel transport system permease protein|nr:transporter permease [Glaciihabitans sp.]MDQ1544165.1 glutathione transport system permease protein [Actinomycetota bacterium]
MTFEAVEILEEENRETAPAEEPEAARVHRKGLSRGGLVWRRLRAKPRFWIGGIAIVLLVLWAVLGPLFTPWTISFEDVNYFNYPPTSLHWFGTDLLGHDIYADTMAGLQKSLIIGFVAGPLSTILSAIVGSIAGYIGGKLDSALSWFINLMLVLPSFFILVLLFPFTHGSWVIMMLFLAITDWMIMAQVIRSQTRSLKEREFVKAARYMGFNAWTVVTRHIIPNVASLLIIDAALGVGGMILAETTLSFLGFGVQAPDVSIGTLLSNAEAAAVTRPWLFFYPAVILVVLLFAINLVGDALRDAVDPTSGVNRS